MELMVFQTLQKKWLVNLKTHQQEVHKMKHRKKFFRKVNRELILGDKFRYPNVIEVPIKDERTEKKFEEKTAVCPNYMKSNKYRDPRSSADSKPKNLKNPSFFSFPWTSLSIPGWDPGLYLMGSTADLHPLALQLTPDRWALCQGSFQRDTQEVF